MLCTLLFKSNFFYLYANSIPTALFSVNCHSAEPHKAPKIRRFHVYLTRIPLDGMNYGVDSIVDTVCNHKHLCNSSIILTDPRKTAAVLAKYTAQALDTLISIAKTAFIA